MKINVGFGGLLFLLFLTLRLTGVIAWSWVVVAAPLWVPVVIVAFVCMVAVAAS